MNSVDGTWRGRRRNVMMWQVTVRRAERVVRRGWTRSAGASSKGTGSNMIIDCGSDDNTKKEERLIDILWVV